MSARIHAPTAREVARRKRLLIAYAGATNATVRDELAGRFGYANRNSLKVIVCRLRKSKGGDR